MAQPQIHVLLDDPEVPPTIAKALQRIDAGVRLSRLDNELRSPSGTDPDARLVVTSGRQDRGSQHWEALFDHFHAHPCATLVLTSSPVGSAPAGLGDDTGPIGFASDLSADELAGRLTAMCAFRRSFQRLQQEIVELRRRDERRGRRGIPEDFDEQLRLASQIQRDLLPHPLPWISGAVLHALFRPADHVSGDIYDVTRLDEEHLALSCADATGHGMPAALLTMLIKRTLQGKQVSEGAYRLVPPNEVLEQLNGELLEADLTHCLFVTGLYAVYQEVTRTLCWARGGTPYPVLIRPNEPARMVESEGPLLGAVQGATFECVEVALQPGDTVLFHTDGLDALLLNRKGRRLHDNIAQTEWFQQLGTVPIAEHLGDIADRLDRMGANDWPVDDLTVLALEVV